MVTGFHELYIKIRRREQRVYTDEQVAGLPVIDSSHIHFGEWELRKKSVQKLVNYLSAKKKPLKILEIGCGNGWLSAAIAKIAGAEVIGWDVNETELAQAERVFSKMKNLSFENKSVLNYNGEPLKFDIIIFAASVQYFQDFNLLINKVLSLLKKPGEIHILDSVFYNLNEIESARERSAAYFSKMEVPEMAEYYFHHPITTLKNFNHKILYNSASAWNKMLRKKNPFYWISISH